MTVSRWQKLFWNRPINVSVLLPECGVVCLYKRSSEYHATIPQCANYCSCAVRVSLFSKTADTRETSQSMHHSNLKKWSGTVYVTKCLMISGSSGSSLPDAGLLGFLISLVSVMGLRAHTFVCASEPTSTLRGHWCHPPLASGCIHLHMLAFACICLHTLAYVCTRLYMLAHACIPLSKPVTACKCLHACPSLLQIHDTP